jgi:4-amino-4-deoxy-L-arabinose transferase-like glycosyltransferase
MKDDKPIVSAEALLYIAILLLAAWLRLSELDILPLADAEAARALNAASLTPHASPFWQDSNSITVVEPAYYFLTTIVFHLFGASDANARIVPALAGLALVLTPLLVRRRIGRATALVVSALFAISPVLLTTARTASGASLAGLGLVGALALLLGEDKGPTGKVRARWAAAGLGFALAAGPSVFHGLLSLGLGATLVYASQPERRSWRSLIISTENRRLGLWITLGVMLGVAGGFGLALSGLAGLAESLGKWFLGWLARGDTRSLTELAMLAAYEPLVLVFGVVGAVVAVRERDQAGITAAWLSLGGVLSVLVYPARQGSDLIWVVVPLSFLAARATVLLIERIARRRTWKEFLGLTSLLLILIAFAYLQLATYASGSGLSYEMLDRNLRLWVVIGVLFLSVLASVFFGLGWGWSVALEASGAAVWLPLLVFAFAAGWRLNLIPDRAGAQELWRPQASTQGLRLLSETLQGVSQSYTGRVDALDVAILGESSASLAWTLRDFQPARLDLELEGVEPSAIVIRAEGETPAFRAEYVGQELKVGEWRGWSGILPPDPITWWLKRNAPTEDQIWAVLVRKDIAMLEGQD